MTSPAQQLTERLSREKAVDWDRSSHRGRPMPKGLLKETERVAAQAGSRDVRYIETRRSPVRYGPRDTFHRDVRRKAQKLKAEIAHALHPGGPH